MKTNLISIIIVAVLAFGTVGAFGTTYNLTTEITKIIDDSTAITGKAFGIAPVQTIVTSVTLEVSPPSDAGVYDVSIVSLSQITYGADREKKGYPNEEKLTAVWQGNCLSFDISQAPDGLFSNGSGL